ncbi:hypothetical protein EPO15_06935 [bacterium]|nr:MAG: hypothetical protein EPO15_06935 [bacterium]
MDEEAPVPLPPAPGFNWGLALIPLIAIGLFLYWLVGRKTQVTEDTESAEAQSFNVAEVPHDPEPAPSGVPANYVSPAEAETKARERAPGPGLSGFVTEKDGMFYKDPKAKEDEERQREKDFIAKHDASIRATQEKLSVITRKYYKKEPIVREVDAAFGKLGRYMALKAQYDKDRDAYAFVRGAVGLPEVRKTVYKYATNVDVWRATIGMMTEGLKQKPPPAVYNEIKRVMSDDTKIAGFVTDVTGYMIPRMGTIVPQVIKPGQDIKPIQDLAKELNLGGGPKVNLGNARQTVGRAEQSAPPR